MYRGINVVFKGTEKQETTANINYSDPRTMSGKPTESCPFILSIKKVHHSLSAVVF